ncbi:DNA/RNA non-specific endonuclease [Flammeovirga sp. OC4]|uniref:DNA/RNA non-specific endonuclease n=1 Tax=Flammeovirga sp. OC4 TaxID=1382345 RepID=UPI000693BF7E|nr:DNA/RNA non-specific endonuclease [Flammeovirga sp. OC4]
MHHKLTTLFLLFFISIQLNAQKLQEVPSEYFPSYNENYQVINHQNYSIGYSEKHEQAAFIIYKLTKKELNKSADRSNQFETDPNVTTFSADGKDYYQSGYDRGHLAPAADMAFNQTAMEESFYYSNMSPQAPSFNRGVWKRMEEQVREWALQKDSVIVITGPVLEDGLNVIGPNEVSVPRYFYKIVLSEKGNNEFEAIGMLVKNTKSSLPLSQFYVAVDAIEEVTSIDFFAGLSNQEKFESHYDSAYWTIDNTKENNHIIEHSPSKEALQCEGFTKKGDRCKRNANKNSKFCWQHQ